MAFYLYSKSTLLTPATTIFSSGILADLARTFHKCTRALACPLFPQEILLSRPDPLVRHFFGKSPENTKSCAIIAVIHELSGLEPEKSSQITFLIPSY